MDNTRVFNCDCLPAMKEFPDKYFDLAIVDPPYGIGAHNGTSNSTKKFNKLSQSWDNEIPNEKYFTELFRVSKNQIIWGGNYYRLNPTRGFIFWYKRQPIPNLSDGEFAWTSFDRVAQCFDYAYTNVMEGNGARHEKSIHPTQKPVALYKWLLKNYAKEGDKILDTHLGSGSSRIAAYDMGFDFTGYELDKDYFEAQEKRFRQHKNQLTFDFSPGAAS